MSISEREIAKIYDEALSDLVVSWGYASYGFIDMRSRAIKWLANFEKNETEDAFKILNQIKVVSPNTINNAIESLTHQIRLRIENEPLVISSLEGSSDSSGAQFLYMLSRKLSNQSCKTIAGEIDQIVKNNKIVLLVDDIVGSGGEAISTWEKIKHIDSQVYYCPLFCFEDGKDNIEKEKCFTAFMPQILLNTSEKAFGPKSKYFPDENERKRLEQLALKYGSRLYPKYPLGYKDTQAMIAWMITEQAPNNSLPIIWAGPRNESKDPSWNPIFERIVSPNKFKKNKTVTQRTEQKKVVVTIDISNQPIDIKELIYQTDKAVRMHQEGDAAGYRDFLSKNKISNKLKRAAMFEALRDIAYVDLEISLKTRYARSVLNYIQSCLVLCEIESAINVVHRKLVSDPRLETYSPIDRAAFLRTYAELLNAAGWANLSVELLEILLNSGLVSKIPHAHLSHMMNSLSDSYLSIDNVIDAYDIAKDNYDEQCLTNNEYGVAISGTRLGIALLASSKADDAISLFEDSAAFFRGFDQRACAWAELYCHICALRLGEERTNHLKSAMSFYSSVNHSSNELLTLMKEAKIEGNGWQKDYDKILDRYEAQIAECIISDDYVSFAKDFCNAFKAMPIFPGANAINHRVSKGDFRQNSLLTNSFLRSLNKKGKSKYLNKIASTNRFYLSPFYNKLFRYLTYKRPDLVKEIIFPKLDEISLTTDSIRVFYARLLERHEFIKKANTLLESVEDKSQYRYLNNKANILARQLSTLNNALNYYMLAVDATEKDQEKSVAYNNHARAILQKKVKSKYEDAEKTCRLSLEHRLNERFFGPVQTLILLSIDKNNLSDTTTVLTEFQKEFCLTSGQLRKIINDINNKKKYIQAEKFLISLEQTL